MKTVDSNSRGAPGFRPAAYVPLLITYTVCVHLTVLAGETGLASLLLLAAPIVLLLASWSARLVFAIGLGIAAASGAVSFLEQGPPLYYLPPILINLSLAALFGRSLRKGHTPLITQYSVLMRGRLEPRVVGYTRRVTQVWAVFFALLAAESTVLAMFASLETWSLFTNVLNYFFTACLFAGEYAFRRRRLRSLDHPGFVQFLRSVASIHVSKINRSQ